MRNYVIINGVNSLTIQGLAIKALPPITKPIQRNLREEIDGRDGDIVTTLGYGAYDKTIEIGLFGTFDIDEVIAFFNQKGTITFSNEADKVYYFEALDQVDYAELLKFRTANVVLHCQPFKYPLNETPLVEEYEYVEATGTNVTLDNTSEAIFNKIDLLGNTEQVQYTGKNKLPTTSFTLTKGTNRTIQINFPTPIPAGTYTLSCKITNKSGFTTTDGLGWALYDGSVSPAVSRAVFQPIYSNTTSPYSNTRTTTGQSTHLYVYISSSLGDDATITLEDVQLEQNSTATDFEPYVGGIPSPNPNYPQDIHVVSGDNTIEITGRNLANLEDIQIGKTWSGTNNANKATLLHIPLEAGTTYTLLSSYTNTHITQIRGVLNKGPGVPTDNLVVHTPQFTRVNFTHVSIEILADSTFQEAYLDGVKIMLCKGVATEWEAYTGQTYPLNLGDLEMASIPNTNYKDVFVKDGDTWYKREAVGKIILDGTEVGWSSEGGGAPFAYPLEVVRDNTKTTLVSNNFIGLYWNARWGDYNSFVTCNNASSSNPLIKFKYPGTSNLNDFKTWLGTHNTEVRYARLETQDIEVNETLANQLEEIKNAISYNGQTNISQTNNDLPFILDLSALKENSDHLVIDNIGNIYSKPTLDLEGTGIVDIYLNDTQMFEVDLSEKNEIVIDTEKMEAYNPTDNTLANRQVTGDYSKFKLDSGENDLRFSGDLTKATITNYERWL